MVFFSPLIWLVVWAWDIPVNAIDHWTKDTCYWSWLSPICSYGCSISPWFVVYLFSNTCSHHVSQKGPTVDPLWQTAIASDEMDNIPWLIALRESHCYYYSVGIEQIRDALPISEDAKNNLQPMQDKICSELEDTSSYRSFYRRHVKIFSAAVLHSVDIEQAQTLEASSYSMLEQQNKFSEVMPDLMAQWQKRYDYFVSPGEQMSKEVRASRQKVVAYLKILLHLKEETSRARTDKIKSWGLPRRAARGIGLLRSDPPELYGYNDALEALDGWIVETMAVIRLYTMIEIEVAELDSSLRNAAARKFSTDVRFRLGPEGLLELYSYWMRHGSRRRKVNRRCTISSEGRESVMSGLESATIRPARFCSKFGARVSLYKAWLWLPSLSTYADYFASAYHCLWARSTHPHRKRGPSLEPPKHPAPIFLSRSCHVPTPSIKHPHPSPSLI